MKNNIHIFLLLGGIISALLHADLDKLAVRLKDITKTKTTKIEPTKKADPNEDLFKAIEASDIENIKKAFAAGADINATTKTTDGKQTFSMLGIAIRQGKIDVVTFLLSKHPNLNNVAKIWSERHGGNILYSAFGYAIYYPVDKDIVQLIWDATPNDQREKVVAYPKGTTYSALGQAIEEQNNDEILEMIFNTKNYISDADVVHNPDGTTMSAIQFSTLHASGKTTKKIKEYFMRMNTPKNTPEMSALHKELFRAIRNPGENNATLEKILQQKPDIDVWQTDASGNTKYTPLGRALSFKADTSVIKRLLQENPAIDKVREKSDGTIDSALALAIEVESPDFVKLILEKKPDIAKAIILKGGDTIPAGDLIRNMAEEESRTEIADLIEAYKAK